MKGEVEPSAAQPKLNSEGKFHLESETLSKGWVLKRAFDVEMCTEPILSTGKGEDGRKAKEEGRFSMTSPSSCQGPAAHKPENTQAKVEGSNVKSATQNYFTF